MALTPEAIADAAPTDKPFKLFDGHGLHLFVQPDGRKYWRLKFRILGRERSISFGPYPRVSLDEARSCAEQARELIRNGIDPVAERRERIQANRRASRSIDEFRALRVAVLTDNTFELWKGHVVVSLNADEARYVV